MFDCAFVTNEEKTVGFWIQDIAFLCLDQSPAAFLAILRKNKDRFPNDFDITGMVLQKDYRIVPNQYDTKGGHFIMFGNELAPGE